MNLIGNLIMKVIIYLIMDLTVSLIRMEIFDLFYQPYIKKMEIKKFNDRLIDLRTIFRSGEKKVTLMKD